MRYIQVSKLSIEEINSLTCNNKVDVVFNNWSIFGSKADEMFIQINTVINFFEPLIKNKQIVINIYSKFIYGNTKNDNSIRYYFVTNYSEYINYKLVYMFFDKNCTAHNRYQLEKVEFQNLEDSKNLMYGSMIFYSEIDSNKQLTPISVVHQNDSVFGYIKALEGTKKPTKVFPYPQPICKTCKFFNCHYSPIQCSVYPTVDTYVCYDCKDYETDEFKSMLTYVD
jgi:hypothetical protein